MIASRLPHARRYIAYTGYADARRELGRVTNETRPTIVADWAVKDVPRARKLLEAIRGKA